MMANKRFHSTADVKRLQKWNPGDGSLVVVLRRSIIHGWVDIQVVPAVGAWWTKRMPAGLPIDWVKVCD